MEDARARFVLILAGYPEEMKRFLTMNTGLPSRFPLKLTFPDFTVEQLLQISREMAASQDYEFTPGAFHQLHKFIERAKQDKGRAFSNARYVRNLIEQMIRAQAERLVFSGVTCDIQALRQLTEADVTAAEKYEKGWDL
ncbi:hypothetical protein B0H94_101191 [Salsuginibacillus halophilus]|uniref:CbbX AAA lid domain-containing protein n=1 Tax=Salsuginibacillus halophilus TaxID=517424 RepID=A0A2P8HYH5_9BACI|nr:hypothetical protein [Salsuginibacillus halophilus]PSL51281.1 hypothetical protein B0H94_101191 [Salsuginibacillus halophilus]